MESESEQAPEWQRFIDIRSERIKYYKDRLYMWETATWITRTEKMMVCQMCLEPKEQNPDRLCHDCYILDVVRVGGPMNFMEPRRCASRDAPRPVYLLPENPYFYVQCRSCTQPLPRGKRIRLSCCKKIVCKRCYIDSLEDYDTPECPLCDSFLPINLWIIDDHYRNRASKPGFLAILMEKYQREEMYDIYSESELCCKLKANPMGLLNLQERFCHEKWLVRRFETWVNAVMKEKDLALRCRATLEP